MSPAYDRTPEKRGGYSSYVIVVQKQYSKLGARVGLQRSKNKRELLVITIFGTCEDDGIGRCESFIGGSHPPA